ncbi:hypothetical protein O181_133113 [Austropuccinia psidii MF-1]|uniref:Uncharacterized protein n=1 Tax=Austropuccinia psidii MF-1 TaxID=1389203 RepID=A0A9Q3L3M6_9BASI|nr:hypothetical protein [Austropuccinia psidii MF-1]
MPIQHSPPARQTRPQARTQAVLTPTPRAPLDGTPAVSQLRAKLDRGPTLEGAAPSRKEGRVPRRSSSFSGVVGGFPGTSRTILKVQVRKAEAELDSLRMKEGGHVSLYIADVRSLFSRIGYWGERALIQHFRKGLPTRILDQLASHPSRTDSLQDLMDITLELDTRYHERQNEKSHHQEKKPEASKSNSSSSTVRMIL